MTLKVSFPWFMDGKEVELPDIKIEGSLAVAELTKQHADEFIPFVTILQEEATLRMRLNALSDVLLSKSPVTDDHHATAKAVLSVYNIDPAESNKELFEQYSALFDKLKNDLVEYGAKTARAHVMATPFFLRRALVEAFYMFKAYIWDEARKNGAKPKMPFSQEELETMIDDPGLAIFSRYAMSKIRKSAEEEIGLTESEDIKKKLTDIQET